MKYACKYFYNKYIKIACAILFFPALFSPVFADEDCIAYKVSPKIEIQTPEWQKSVVQPLKPMDLLHGNVLATYIENYELAVESIAIEDGFCIILKEVKAIVGYNDFLVQIDARHRPGSCGYEIILAHEDEHIRAHLTTIDENSDAIKSSVVDASDNVLPVFVKSLDNADKVLDIMNKELQENPNLILMRQKISADQELRNKKIDQNEDNSRINKCLGI